MRSKKNSSLILLGVFTLGVAQSCVVEALTETSANLAKEINDESKQQDIDVNQGAYIQSVDSKNESFLYINDDKKIKNMSKTTKAICGGGIAGVSGLLLSAAAIVVKKTLDSEQNNSNKNNNDSERNKEVEKDLDDQKEKADNQDSKDEVKNSDSKSILLPLFIVLGLAVVVGTIVYFVCKGKRINMHQQTSDTSTNEESNNVNEFEEKKLDTSTNKESNNEVKKLESEPKEESNNVNEFSFVSESKNDDNESESGLNDDESESEDNEPEIEPEVGKKVEELYKRLENIKVNVEKVWTLEKLKKIFKRSSNLVLETLLGKGDDELKTLWFCDKNAKNKVNMKILFNEKFESVFKKFFEGDLKLEKKELFSLLINTGNDNLEKLLNLFSALNKNGFDKIDLTTKIAKILLKDTEFTRRLALEGGDHGKIIRFTAAILTGKFKEGQKSFKVNINMGKNFSYTFGNSPVYDLNALLSGYEKVSEKIRIFFLEAVAFKYRDWESEQQKQEYSNENNVENIIIDNN